MKTYRESYEEYLTKMIRYCEIKETIATKHHNKCVDLYRITNGFFYPIKHPIKSARKSRIFWDKVQQLKRDIPFYHHYKGAFEVALGWVQNYEGDNSEQI